MNETLERARDVALMERALADARRALTLAEIDLIFAAHGEQQRMDAAKAKFAEVAEILNTHGVTKQ